MDSHHFDEYPDPRSPYAPWLLIAFTGIVFMMATLAGA